MRFAVNAQTRPAIAAQATKAWPSVTPNPARKGPVAGLRAHVGPDRHLERRPDRVQPQEEAIDDQTANERGDERARRALGRDRVPQRIKKPGRRGWPDADNIGRDQSDGVAKKRADQNHKPDRLEIGRRFENDGKGNEQCPADGRTQSCEQEHDADHRDKEGPPAHCASSFRPARMSAAVSAAGPS